jgi:hypothetical protein
MPRDDVPSREMTLPPLAWAGLFGAGFMLLLLVVGIAALIVILQDSRNHIRSQDAKLALAVRTARDAAPQAEQAANDVLPLLNDARPVVRKVSRAIGPLTRSGDTLATATEDLPRLIRTAQALAAVALPVLSDLGYRARLVRALDSTNEMLDKVRAEDLIRLAAHAARDAPEIVRLQRRTVRVQLASLETQRLQLKAQLETLDIQREALVHIRSIDQKTGGTAPATPTAAPPPARASP